MADSNAKVVVKIEEFSFFPSNLTVSIGSEVVWRQCEKGSSHSILHSGGLYESSNLGYGDEFNVSFSQTGSYEFYDPVYPFMVCHVDVVCEQLQEEKSMAIIHGTRQQMMPENSKKSKETNDIQKTASKESVVAEKDSKKEMSPYQQREIDAFVYAAACNQLSIVRKWLVRTDGGITDCIDSDGMTALQAASKNGHPDIVTCLLVDGKSNPNIASGEDQNTAMHLAAMWGHANVVNALSSKGASAILKNDFASLPLHLAASNGHVKVTEALLSQNEDPYWKDYHGQTPLEIAKDYGHARKEIYDLIRNYQETVFPRAVAQRLEKACLYIIMNKLPQSAVANIFQYLACSLPAFTQLSKQKQSPY